MAGAESFDISDGRGAARRERASAEREATVSRILAGARAVLREHTVFDLTFAVVADAAGTTRQTVHTYFPSVSDLIFAIADEVTVAFQRAGTGLDAGASDFPYRYADQVADIALADQIPNRQVLLVSASQGRRGSPASLSWEEVVPVLEQRSPVSADDAAWLLLTLFRGALFTWAVEEMSEEALRADLHKVADLVTAQRRVWSEEAERAGNL
jgi:AcrR family transcriptional regulator